MLSLSCKSVQAQSCTEDKFLFETTDQPKCVCPTLIHAVLLKDLRHLQDDSVAAAMKTQRRSEIQMSNGSQIQTKGI